VSKLGSIHSNIRTTEMLHFNLTGLKTVRPRWNSCRPLRWGHTSAWGTYVATHILHDGRCWGLHTARVNLAGNSGAQDAAGHMLHEKTWRQWDIHGETQATAKTTKRWSTVKDETAVIQEDNRIRQVTNVKLASVWPTPFEGTQSCDVTQQGSTCVLA
jgi:hypothetical protein